MAPAVAPPVTAVVGPRWSPAPTSRRSLAVRAAVESDPYNMNPTLPPLTPPPVPVTAAPRPPTLLGDAYASGLPLPEGIEKHTISVFVADETGLINRVAGVFARRGANIESLAVGLNHDRALFTIVTVGTRRATENLVKQLSKLVKVRYVEDVTVTAGRNNCVERELLLAKVRAPAGSTERSALLQTVEAFRGKINDMTGELVTVSCSGDPGKTEAFARALSTESLGGQATIVQLARTGRAVLKRGSSLLVGDTSVPFPPTTPQWGGLVEGRRGGLAPESDGTVPEEGPVSTGRFVDGDTPAVDGPSMGVYGGRDTTKSGDGRPSGFEGQADDWGSAPEAILSTAGASSLLSAPAFSADLPPGGNPGDTPAISPRILSVLLADEAGILGRVTSVISRRGFNVLSLAVGHAEVPGLSRITVAVPSTEQGARKLCVQIEKLVGVIQATDLALSPVVGRELMLLKVGYTRGGVTNLREIGSIFRASVVDLTPTTCTFEVSGREGKMRAFQELLAAQEGVEVLEVARTGIVALSRASGVDSKYLATTGVGFRVQV